MAVEVMPATVSLKGDWAASEADEAVEAARWGANQVSTKFKQLYPS